jgi:multidrug resistance efflux pump
MPGDPKSKNPDTARPGPAPAANPPPADADKEVASLKGKINVLSGILQLGHESFRKIGIDALAIHIVNNSRSIVPFDRSSLIDARSASPHLLAVTGQPEVNRHSDYGAAIRTLAGAFHSLDKPTVVTEEVLRGINAGTAAFEAFKSIRGKDGYELHLVPLRAPGEAPCRGQLFIWALEFFTTPSPVHVGLLALLGQHYGESLWYAAARRRIPMTRIFGYHRITPMRVFLALLLIFTIALGVVRLRQGVAADFEIVPVEKTILYAPYSGIIESALAENGATVAANDLIIRYDAREIAFKKLELEKQLAETEAERLMAEQKAFIDPESKGKAKLLSIEKERKQVEIDRAAWYLARSEVRATRAGILLIPPKEELAGRSIQAGERLFEIFPQGKMIAEIMVSETDASILASHPSLTLYLHASPDQAITATAIDVSPRPVLSDQRQYCYRVKASLAKPPANMICGMRGVARLHGEKVSLGYYLFRHAILWWRRTL